jgi:hypothetical protein
LRSSDRPSLPSSWTVDPYSDRASLTDPLSRPLPPLLPRQTAAKAGLSFAQNGGYGEKPRSSVSALIDILCLDKYEEDDYEGITELVESINLQPTTGFVLFSSFIVCSSQAVLTSSLTPPYCHFTERRRRLGRSGRRCVVDDCSMGSEKRLTSFPMLPPRIRRSYATAQVQRRPWSASRSYDPQGSSREQRISFPKCTLFPSLTFSLRVLNSSSLSLLR